MVKRQSANSYTYRVIQSFFYYFRLLELTPPESFSICAGLKTCVAKRGSLNRNVSGNAGAWKLWGVEKDLLGLRDCNNWKELMCKRGERREQRGEVKDGGKIEKREISLFGGLVSKDHEFFCLASCTSPNRKRVLGSCWSPSLCPGHHTFPWVYY